MQDLGDWGESEAARYLSLRGYRILDRRWRSGRLEIDLVVERDLVVAFVEVKTRRPGVQAAAEAVNFTKRRHIRRAASAWIATRPHRGREYRFDVVTIVRTRTGRCRLRHIEGAFDGEDA